MAQNTAMQTLFDELEKLGENYSESFKEFHLSNERQQIINTVDSCWTINDKLGYVPDGSTYFTQTFNQNK